LIRADLHIHTIYSGDSAVNPKTLVEKLVTHNSIKVAAVTDHDTTNGLRETRRLASAYPDILIIPGVVISTSEGDIIVLGAEEMPPRPLTIQSVIDFARTNNYVSVVAHPYRNYGMGDSARNYKVDAIEIFNGESSSHDNKEALNLARIMRLPGVAGSDSHHSSELLTVYTEIKAELNVNGILKAIKNGLVTTHSIARSIRF
jgi:predicted metal-dependent phosphoesterase TrpH